jgi:hypothetical protein
MPIDIPPAPPQSISALRSAFPSLVSQPALSKIAPHLAAALRDTSAVASLTPVLSYRVYTLGLSDLVTDGNDVLRAVKPAGWRHILLSGEERVTVDVSTDPAGSNHKFAALSTDPSAAEVQKEIDALTRDRDLAPVSYQFSLLQIPALAVRVIWLHDTSGKAPDLLVPVAPARKELIAGRKYQVAEFVEALRGTAARILENDDPGKGST